MKAIVYERYGPPEVLQLREVPTPAPGEDDVLIRVRSAVVNMGDCEMRRPEIPNAIWLLVRLALGLRRPRRRILGSYFAGEVASVGSNVSRLRVGDKVFAASGARFGAYAEYVCLPAASCIAAMPANLSYEEAAVVPLGGLNALHYLREAKLRPGERVLVNGAGGSFGTFAVQLARLMGARVTAVDGAEKLDLLRELGAERVIDYAREDPAASGEPYDVVFNVVARYPYSRALSSLGAGGRYLLTNPAGIAQMLRAVWTSRTSDRKVIVSFARETSEELDHLRELIEEGKLRPVIDRSYPLEQAAEAHRYVETGRKRGDVVLTMHGEAGADRVTSPGARDESR